MINLSVNINKIATLRNARGGNVPNVENVAVDCERFGANGITVHPRPDERHIRRADVYALRPLIRTEFNIKPTQVTLVPDAPDALTSTAGWEVAPNMEFLTGIVTRLQDAGIRTSIFVSTDVENIRQAAKTGTDRVELYTGPYAAQFKADPEKAIAPFAAADAVAHSVGLGINGGHDLNLENLKYFKDHMPHLLEVSIGHAIISDALYLGLEQTIKAYKECLK